MHRRHRGLSGEDFDALYVAEAEGLLVFFTRRTLEPESALDLWSETIASAFASRRTFRGESSQARAWLYGIASRQLAMFWRRGAVEQRALRRLGLERPSPNEDQLQQLLDAAGLQELQQQVLAALDQLPESQRRAVRLRIVDELPYSEVARLLGVHEDAARARVSRAMRTMAKMLSNCAMDLKEVVK